MSEDQADYVTEAMELLKGEPAAIIEQPRARYILRDGMDEQWTVAWVKMSTAFKPHIKELRGAPLAVWLFICLSINQKGVAFPGIRTIADETGYSHQGVLDAIKTLEEKGYLIVKRGERRFNIYKPEFAAIGQTNEPSQSVNSVDSSFSLERSTFSPEESSPLDLNKNNKNKQDTGKTSTFKDPMWDLLHGKESDPEQIQSIEQVHNVALRLEEGLRRGQFPETPAAQKVYKWVLAREKEGQPLEKFIAWAMDGKRAEYSFIYHKDLELIKRDWPQVEWKSISPKPQLDLEVPNAVPNPGRKPLIPR